MNKCYTRENNFVTVYTENEGVRLIDDVNNLEELLVEEDKIETFEDAKEKLKKILSSLMNYKKVCKYIVPTCFSLVIICFFAFNINFDILAFIALLSSFSPMIAGLSFLLYSDLKEISKRKKAINKTINYLDNEIVKENEKIEQLRADKVVQNKVKLNNENIQEDYDRENSKIYIEDKEALKQLKREIIFRYKLVYNEQLYLKYYNNNTLDEKLKDEFTQQEIEQIKDYFNYDIKNNNNREKVKYKVRV